jgi:hypothetical protein
MTGIGHRRCVPARPPRNALRRFTFVRHHDASMASFRPALTEIPQRITHWDRPVNSGPRPCLFDVGFPLSGSRDRTSTSDLNIRTQHTRKTAHPGPSPAEEWRLYRSRSITSTGRPISLAANLARSASTGTRLGGPRSGGFQNASIGNALRTLPPRPPSPKGGIYRKFVSGASRDRTGDLLLAKQALSQLSYGPEVTESNGAASNRARAAGYAPGASSIP